MNLAPINAQAKTISISATSSASSSAALPAQGSSIRLVNTSSVTAYVHITSGAAVATVPTGTAANTCTPVLGPSDITLSIPNDAILNISAITRTGSTTLEVQVGEGI